jgi:predicted  nucleic acid-binding Zn-ribbon protein
LRDLKTAIEGIKNNTKWQDIANLRQQLQQLQQLPQQLQEKQNELDKAKATIQDLQSQIQGFNNQIQAKNDQIQKLLQDSENKEKQIKDIQQQIQQLTDDKKALEDNLNAKTNEVNGLANNIQMITGSLAKQIENINQIADQLGDLDNGEIGEEFGIITQNITAIIELLEGRRSGGAETIPQPPLPDYDVETNFNNLLNLHNESPSGQYLQYMEKLKRMPNGGIIKRDIDNLIKRAEEGNGAAIEEIKRILKTNKLKVDTYRQFGGKRRHKTMKKRHRRTRKKMRGGYVWKRDKNLDNASSVVSISSNSKFKSYSSKSKSQKNDKTRRKSYK